PLEHAADGAFLPPDVAGPELSVRGQACELGAGPGPARGAVVRPAGAENEGPPLVGRVKRRAGQLDVIDLGPSFAGDSGPGEFPSHSPGVVGQAIHVL